MPKNRTPVVTGLNSDRGTIDWRDEFLSMGTNLQYYLVIRQAYIDKVKALIKEADLEEDEVSGYLKWLKWLNDGPAGLERVLEDMGEDRHGVGGGKAARAATGRLLVATWLWR